MKKRIILISLIFICLASGMLVLHYYTGIFYTYSFVTANVDVANNKIQIIRFDTVGVTEQEELDMADRFGFKLVRLAKNDLSDPQMNGVFYYNKLMTSHLKKNQGANWEEEYRNAVDSLFRERKIDLIKEKVLQQKEVIELNKALDFTSEGKETLMIKVFPQEKNKPNVWVGRIFPDKTITVYHYYKVDPYTMEFERVVY